MAFCEIRCGGRPVISSPSNRMRPPEGRITPVRQLKNVDLPAPLGPMMARISPRRTVRLTPFNAVRPPNRTVSPSVWRMGPETPRPSAAGAPVPATRDSVTLGELACGREDGLLLRDHLHDAVLAALDLEDELAQEGLVVLLAQRLVALREVGPFLDLEALERRDQLHAVGAALEAGLLDADLEEVHRLVVGLHVPIRQRPGRIDRLQPLHRLVEERLVMRRVERGLHDGDVPVDPVEALDLAAEGGQVRRLGDGAVTGPLVLLGETEVVRLVADGDAVTAEEDAEQPVEVAGDPRQERRHVRRPERDAGAAHDLAPRP